MVVKATNNAITGPFIPSPRGRGLNFPLEATHATGIGTKWTLNLSLQIIVAVISLLLFFGLKQSGAATSAPTGQSEIEEKWGVKIEGIKSSAAGYMLDFRFRIIDPDKAAILLDRTVRPYLTDQASGAKFIVPSPAKIGPLRQTNRNGKPIAGRTYFILFANPGKYVKPGNKVSVNIGEFMAKDMTVR